ncbi:MAG: germination protein YpeB [Oscillospiraceae bacterium]
MINLTLSRRGIIRIVLFGVAAISALTVRNCQLMNQSSATAQTVSTSYRKAIEDLSASADKINTTLAKELYTGTPELQMTLANRLWSDASDAKNALSQLPVNDLNLSNTYKFLSQVGNYSLALSEKVAQGKELSDEEYKNLESLYTFSEKLCDDMWIFERRVSVGEIDLNLISDTLSGGGEGTPTVSDGFTDFEEGFDDYPSLIYDGPFSDNILEKEPEMLKGQAEVTQDAAAQVAAKALNIAATDLTAQSAEAGKMPSYTFSANGAYCSVTKAGGFLSYFLKERSAQSTAISNDQAIDYADAYLKTLGISGVKTTYYETYNNVCIINYAGVQNDVTLYTDLIKVSVSMENGEILGFDARGWLVNHKERTLSKPNLTVEDAQKKLSPLLNVQSKSLALIPSDATEELLCYEFTCTAKNNRHVLVYVNALTGKEEQILILIESEFGVLTV